jgi:DUF1365 family protein
MHFIIGNHHVYVHNLHYQVYHSAIDLEEIKLRMKDFSKFVNWFNFNSVT